MNAVKRKLELVDMKVWMAVAPARRPAREAAEAINRRPQTAWFVLRSNHGLVHPDREARSHVKELVKT